MCLGIPGQVREVRTDAQTGMRMGKVDFGGVVRDVSLAFVPDAGLGDYVLVHVGFAISRMDEAEAKETLALLQEMEILSEEVEPEVHREIPG